MGFSASKAHDVTMLITRKSLVAETLGCWKVKYTAIALSSYSNLNLTAKLEWLLSSSLPGEPNS